ncbi:hypothetical protein GQ55_9G177800 [Panicum hallii var. hallii]|uniref:Uncharacterized protein n=1 Tax=Panicum hallii var. hallii TaxID=1504633 RepID=A0A2T7C4C5_9POAL|nr:hypothetical protein GQ55_9G177800 [Panicum hallii var. hallii]
MVFAQVQLFIRSYISWRVMCNLWFRQSLFAEVSCIFPHITSGLKLYLWFCTLGGTCLQSPYSF